MTLDVLFDVPSPAPLAKPRTVTTPSGRPTWTPYKSKTDAKCDDCLALALESLLAGATYELVRGAHFKRAVHGVPFRLYCYDHARTQRDLDEVMFPGRKGADATGGGKKRTTA